MASGSTRDDVGDALTLVGEESSASASAWRLDRGAMLGRYVVLARLGEGGMGVVYAAYDPELDRKVALKLLHRPDGVSPDGTSGRARLIREAQAMARLSHPNVVTVHDVGTVDDRVFVALEFVDGRTLAEWRRESPRPWREVVDVMRRAGLGLAAAHAVGLLHRDFKPDNVMIDVDGRVRVMDFGLARSLGPEPKELRPASPWPESASTAMSITRLLGTPAYMAPEQLAHGPTDARTDVFAFGVSLWELLYGTRPFAGDSLPELAANVLAGRVVTPPKDSRVPAWIRRIAARAIARAPEDRWPSMQALLDALSRDPARKRKRTGAIVGVVVAPLAVLGAARLDAHRTAKACEARADVAREVWNEEAAERARQGLVATEMPYAATTWEKARPWIDDYARELSRMRVEACRDAEVDGTISADRHARIDTCLDARQEELASMLAAFADADAGTVEDAVMTASTLTRLVTCNDERVLASSTNDRAPREARSPADEALRRSFDLRHADQRDEALKLSRRARDLAREEGDVALEATAELRASRLLEALGDQPGAGEAAKAAYFIAGAAGIDDTAAEAANALVRIVGLGQGDAAAGLQWARHARMVHARIGLGELGTREIDLADTVAQIHRTTGDFEAARRQHESALELVEHGFGPQHPRNARLLNNLGLDEYALGDYEDALATYARGIDIAERTFGTDHPTYATLLVNVAIVHYALGDHDAALSEHQRALPIFESHLGPDHPDLAASLNGMGSIHFERGELELAREYLGRTFDIVVRTRPPGHGDIATIATNLGSVYEDLGQLDRAIELHTQALQIWEKAYGPDHPDVAVALNNLGSAHYVQSRYEEAGREHRRALEIRERVYGPDNPEIVSSLLGVGLVELQENDPQGAIAHLQRALEIVERHHITGLPAARIRGRLGHALEVTGRDPERGRALIARARADAVELGNERLLAEIDQWSQGDRQPASSPKTHGTTTSTTAAGRRAQRK